MSRPCDPAASADVPELSPAFLRAVQSWRRRERYPRADQARRIVEVTEGRVDFSGIFAEARAVGAGQQVA